MKRFFSKKSVKIIVSIVLALVLIVCAYNGYFASVALKYQKGTVACEPWSESDEYTHDYAKNIEIGDKDYKILCLTDIHIRNFATFGAGGGMMMLLVLTSVLGYELKTAVGTSVFIMSITALTGSVSHFAIGGKPDVTALVVCIVSTLVFAQIAALIANKAKPKTLNRITGVILVILGISVFAVKLITK